MKQIMDFLDGITEVLTRVLTVFFLVLLFVVAVIFLLQLVSFVAQAAPAAGVARVVVADCRESVIIWQNAPAVGLQGSYAFVGWTASPYDAPFLRRYVYTETLRNGNAVYYSDGGWYGPELDRRVITVTGGTIYAPGDVVLGHVAADDVFSIVCERVYLPAVER